MVDMIWCEGKRLRYSTACFTKQPAKCQNIRVAFGCGVDEGTALVLGQVFAPPTGRIKALSASAFFDVEVSTLPFCISQAPASGVTKDDILSLA